MRKREKAMDQIFRYIITYSSYALSPQYTYIIYRCMAQQTALHKKWWSAQYFEATKGTNRLGPSEPTTMKPTIIRVALARSASSFFPSTS